MLARHVARMEETFTTSYPITLTSILILSSHLRLGLTSCHFPSGFPIKISHEFIMSPMCVTRSARLIFLDLTTLITFGDEYKL